MNSLTLCLNAIIPVFLVILTGYLAKRAGFIREEDVGRINAVAYRVFMPFMCFYNIWTSDLSTVLEPKLIAFAAGGILAMFFGSWALCRRLYPERAVRSVVVQGLFRTNYLILGSSLAAGLTGGEGMGLVAVLAAVAVPLFNVLAVVLFTAESGKKAGPGALFLGILKNPLIVGSLLGIAALAAGLKLPAPVTSAVRDLAKIASPLLLFLLGAFFRVNAFRSHARELTFVTLGRLVVLPVLFLTAAALLGFRGPAYVALLALFGSSTAANSFSLAAEMGGDAALAGDIVVATSALSSLTLFLLSFVSRELGLF